MVDARVLNRIAGRPDRGSAGRPPVAVGSSRHPGFDKGPCIEFCRERGPIGEDTFMPCLASNALGTSGGIY